LRKLYLSNPNVAPGCDPDDPFSPRFWPERLEQPLRRKKPAKIFTVDMGDLFHPTVPTQWVDEVFAIAGAAPQHTFMYLTKSPAGLPHNWLWEDNEWLGITVTNQTDWDERWPILAQVDCAIKFVSFEPLLEFTRLEHGERTAINWAIIGAKTGRQPKQPKAEWVHWLIGGLAWGTPVFMKDNLDCEAMGIQRRQEWPEETR